MRNKRNGCGSIVFYSIVIVVIIMSQSAYCGADDLIVGERDIFVAAEPTLEFDKVYAFDNSGMAWVEKDGKGGFVNIYGDIIVPLEYDILDSGDFHTIGDWDDMSDIPPFIVPRIAEGSVTLEKSGVEYVIHVSENGVAGSRWLNDNLPYAGDSYTVDWYNDFGMWGFYRGETRLIEGVGELRELSWGMLNRYYQVKNHDERTVSLYDIETEKLVIPAECIWYNIEEAGFVTVYRAADDDDNYVTEYYELDGKKIEVASLAGTGIPEDERLRYRYVALDLFEVTAHGNKKKMIMNRAGKIISPHQDMEMEMEYVGAAFFGMTKKGQWGMVNTSIELVFPYDRYDESQKFSFWSYSGSATGGHERECQYQEPLYYFHNSLMWIKKDGKYGILQIVDVQEDVQARKQANAARVVTVQEEEVVKIIRIRINGEELILDQEPVMENDRVLVPLRGIFEALDAEVVWDETTQTVTATRGEGFIVLRLQIGSDTLLINEREVILDVPAKIVNGRTLVPVRAVTEAFGAEVEWSERALFVSIYFSAIQAQQMDKYIGKAVAIINKSNGLAMTSGFEGEARLQPYDGNVFQLFYIEVDNRDALTYSIGNAHLTGIVYNPFGKDDEYWRGKLTYEYISNSEGTTAKGEPVHFEHHYTGWRFESMGDDYFIIGPQSAPTRVLDAGGKEAGFEYDYWLWDRNDTDLQIFEIRVIGEVDELPGVFKRN